MLELTLYHTTYEATVLVYNMIGDIYNVIKILSWEIVQVCLSLESFVYVCEVGTIVVESIYMICASGCFVQ